MKLTLVPYLLICWLLVKFGIVKKTAGNFVAMGLGAVFVLFMLLTFTRYYAFIDLTASTTVKAPHIVLNTPAGGACSAVTDAEIVDGIRLLARTEGIFGETAAGVTIATLAKLAAEGVVRRDERVVAYVTGHGLKTLDAIEPHVRVTTTIPPSLDAFRAAFPTLTEEA